MKDVIEFCMPDDWHHHFRDGNVLHITAINAAAEFNRVVAMPNLIPPVTKVAHALEYRTRIYAVLNTSSKHQDFEPVMVLYLTDNTTPDDIREAHQMRIPACKLYPQGATTNSESGVTDISKIYDVLEIMEELGVILLVHGEVTTPEVDVFSREQVFVDTVLVDLVERFPRLKIVLEHVSSSHGVSFVLSAPATVAATITAHHLLINRNDLLVGGLHAHNYCLPIVKSSKDQEAIIEAATSGNPKFFLGTDSAPHKRGKKESGCSAAGCYTGYGAISLYLEAFDKAGALDRFEDFASKFGAQFYGYPTNEKKVRYEKTPWVVPDHISRGDIIPFWGGKTLSWKRFSPQ